MFSLPSPFDHIDPISLHCLIFTRTPNSSFAFHQAAPSVWALSISHGISGPWVYRLRFASTASDLTSSGGGPELH